MRIRDLLTAVLIAPFLLTCSVVDGVYVLFDYPLETCPANGFELPERVFQDSGEILSQERPPYCHGFTGYRVKKAKSLKFFSRPGGARSFDDSLDGGVPIFSRLEFGTKCKLRVIVAGYCDHQQPVEDCAAPTGTKLVGHVWNLKTRTKEYADFFAQRVFAAYKFGIKTENAEFKAIGRADELTKWCEESVPRSPLVSR